MPAPGSLLSRESASPSAPPPPCALSLSLTHSLSLSINKIFKKKKERKHLSVVNLHVVFIPEDIQRTQKIN